MANRYLTTPVLVCGGRDNPDKAGVFAYLDFLLEWVYEDIMIIHGDAQCIDRYAEAWAKSRQQIYCGMPAQWDKLGKAAGTKRNAEMAALSQAEAVVAFRGGRGTLNMISLARNMTDPKPVLLLPDGEFWK